MSLGRCETSLGKMPIYCKIGNFRESFIFANSVKRHIFDAQSSQLRHDLHLSVNNGVNLLFCEGFILHETLHIFVKKKTLTKISEFTVVCCPSTEA